MIIHALYIFFLRPSRSELCSNNGLYKWTIHMNWSSIRFPLPLEIGNGDLLM
jgi:hypothetical protein